MTTSESTDNLQAPVRRTRVMLATAIGLTFFCLAYWTTFVWLWERASATDSYYSHAFLVPFVSGYLIWRKRQIFLRSPFESSRWGLVLIISALLLHLLSTLLYVYFTSGFSIFLLAFGISLYLFGRAITRELLFPLAFLFFMFPLPMAVLDTIAMPMKLFAASAGAAIVTLLGMPLVQEGFQLHFPTTSLVIDDPCSGLRSLISLAALGALCAYFFQAPTWKRMALFIAAIPIALISNILRVTFLASLAFHGKNAASGFYHDLSGIMVFLLALAMLFGTRRVLEWRQ